jgi:xanthine dehydrogenase small subunit
VIESIAMSAGGVAPTPLVLHDTAAFLTGKPLTAELLLEATPILDAELAPIDDVRGSAVYKRLGLRQLFFAHFLALFPDLVDEAALLEVNR